MQKPQTIRQRTPIPQNQPTIAPVNPHRCQKTRSAHLAQPELIQHNTRSAREEAQQKKEENIRLQQTHLTIDHSLSLPPADIARHIKLI